jgi:SulP family sulfate permease
MGARALLPLICLASAYGFQLAPIVKPRITEVAKTNRHPELIAQASAAEASAAEPVPTRTGSIVAGTYSGVMQFTFAAACASIIFAPVGLPLSIGIQHALIGFVITGGIVAKTTGVKSGVSLAVPSFEVLPFLSKFAVVVAGALGAGAGPGVLLATILAGSILSNLLASVLLTVASGLPVDDVESLLPPPVQAGLFSAIGWSLYLLSFDTLGLSTSASSLLTRQALNLWVPANILGIGLWRASRKTDSPLLFPAFILATTALVHGVRLATGTSVGAARSAGWLMAEAVSAPATALWHALSPSLIRWDVIFSAPALKQLVCAALFGPLVNTVLNYVLYAPMVKQKLDLKRELRSHAAATAAAAAVGGYSNYLGLSDTVIHRKIGGLDRLSVYVAVGVGALFLLAYPLCGAVGYLPTLAIAAILVFVGCDFLYDNLVEATKANGIKAGLAAATVLAVCVQKDMLWGSLLGIGGAQAYAWWDRRQQKAQ